MAALSEDPNAIELELIAATIEQAPNLADLLELYTQELGPLFGLERPKNGRYGYANLPLYWSDPLRHPFLIRIRGEFAGFCLVCRTSGLKGGAEVWDMAEFFVKREFRKQSVGTRIARQVWRCFPGPWQIRILCSNVAASEFWHQAARAYAPGRVTIEAFNRDGKPWTLLTF